MHPTLRVFLGRRGSSSAVEPRYDEPAVNYSGMLPDGDIVVSPLSAVGELDFPVPWVRSPDEFANRHLSLQLRTPRPGARHGETDLQQPYVIWQQDIGGTDFVRFSLADRFEQNARGLASQRDGRQTYVCNQNADVLLAVDERPWVILTRIR
ncbi:MAG TPA: hypothetical protein VNP98_06585 [Chthoniobacterales bacterium]|nr:hypothetical protein [Chthoniobacterales bacterium]